MSFAICAGDNRPYEPDKCDAGHGIVGARVALLPCYPTPIPRSKHQPETQEYFHTGILESSELTRRLLIESKAGKDLAPVRDLTIGVVEKALLFIAVD